MSPQQMLLGVRSQILRTGLRNAACTRGLSLFLGWRSLSSGNFAVKFEDRKLLKVSGKDALKVLQNLATNDLNKIAPSGEFQGAIQLRSQTETHPETQSALYTAFLARDGRMITDALVFPTQSVDSSPERGNFLTTAFLLDVHANAYEMLRKHISMYKLRSDAVLEDVSEDFEMWGIVGDEAREYTGSYRMKVFGIDGMKIFHDPRCEQLGARVVNPTDMPPFRLPPSIPVSDPHRYTSHRHSLGILEGPDEMGSKMIPLECNLVEMNGVSFDKGCYLGQELVARTYHTGVVRKRVLPVEISGSHAAVSVGQEVFASAKPDKSIGKILAVTPASNPATTITISPTTQAVALLRLDPVVAGNTLTLGEAGANVRVCVPEHLQAAVSRLKGSDKEE